MTDPTKDHSRVCPQGRALGEQMARLAQPWINKLAEAGEPDGRCKSCAFRAGTVPNGCLQTQMDVLKAVAEKVPFMCHQHDRRSGICHGWFALQVGVIANEQVKGPMPAMTVPWEFSPPDGAANAAD